MRFPALDGYSLGGCLYVGSNANPAHGVVFAAGGGIRAEVYRHFLSFLASHGIAALAFDYRGIGESRPARLRGFVAGFEDWAEYDAGGAIVWMKARYPQAQLTGIGHSIGALLIGASDEAAKLAQLVLICPHTGYHGDYGPLLRVGVQLCWRVMGPPLRCLLGYFPASKFGFGEDLPARVALQWASRSTPYFSFDANPRAEHRVRHLLEQVKQLRLPGLVVSADDDPWATETGVRRFFNAYRNLLVVRTVVRPTADDKRPIGHFGFFRRSQSQRSWPAVLDFLQQHAPSLYVSDAPATSPA